MPSNEYDDQEYREKCVEALADLVLTQAPSLPIGRLIMLCDGVAALGQPAGLPVGKAAADMADALRRAESAQLVFAELLK